MSQPDLTSASAPGILPTKQKTSILTVLLAVALTALVLGCIFLWLEINQYGGFGAVKGQLSSVWPSGMLADPASLSEPNHLAPLHPEPMLPA